MKVLVVGGGGREHALAWKLAQSPRVSQVLVAPGNGGTAREPGVRNLPLADPQALADFARVEGVGLTVIGPEAPLAAGIVDLFRSCGLRIFGPTRAAAQLESSKSFAKDFMRRHGIPTADYATFTDAGAAHAHVDAQGAPIVVKADGLAAGKGVVVAMTAGQAHAAIDEMLAGQGPGVRHAGRVAVVLEAFMPGEEASFAALSAASHRIVPCRLTLLSAGSFICMVRRLLRIWYSDCKSLSNLPLHFLCRFSPTLCSWTLLSAFQ